MISLNNKQGANHYPHNQCDYLLLPTDAFLLPPYIVSSIQLVLHRFHLAALIRLFALQLILICQPVWATNALEPNSNNSKGKIVVGGFPDVANPPYTWINRCTGKIEGILPHVVVRALNEAGYTVEFADPIEMNSTAWTRTFEQLDNGEIDVLAGMYSPAPDNMVITSQPLMKQKDTLIKRKADNLFVSDQVFKSKRGLITDTSANGSKVGLLKRLQNEGYTVDSTPSVLNAIEDVVAGKADYLITDYYFALSLLTEKEMINSVEMVEWSDRARGIHAAVKKGSQWEKIIPVMDNRFAMYQQSGLTEHLSQNYLLNWLKSKECSSLLPQGQGKLSNIK